MKSKILIIAIMALFTAFACYARDVISHDPSVLPQSARALVETHFPDVQINHIKIDHHTFGGNEYDVVLTNGTEIDFDSKGNIEEIDCGRMGIIPKALIKKEILDYVTSKYQGQNIIKYEIKRNGYEVELQSGLDLEFNKQGAFMRVDH